MILRTAFLRVGTLLLVTSVAAPVAANIEPGSQPVWREPRITYLDPPSPEAREIVSWALDRFHDFGLQLPDLEISFPQFCSGKGALYHVGDSSVEFCRINKRRALHEFAHAWDDTSGVVDRAAFQELRGVTVWWGGVDMRSADQGAEHLAQIIAWGLGGAGSADAPQIPRNSVGELTEAFRMLTGIDPASI